MDNLTPDHRSENMRRIKSKGMKPELLVRSLTHRMGYRFRLHAKDLAGKPDLVFRSKRAVIFVNGCFWHGHNCKEGRRVPKSNVDYWVQKIATNRARDEAAHTALSSDGWKILIIWECEKEEAIVAKLSDFLSA